MNSLLEQLRRDEGLRLDLYEDTVGKKTIGYGRNLSDTGISAQEAEYLLMADIARFTLLVRDKLPWTAALSTERQAVLINMAFNMGIAGLLGFKKMLAAVQAADYEQAANEMLASTWATQVGARATRLAEQMRTGLWV